MEGREAIAGRILFLDGYALSLTEDGDPSGFFNLDSRTFYVERLDSMVDERTVVAWLEAWRKKPEAERLLADPEHGKAIEAAIWPKFKMEEGNGNLLMRSAGYQVQIVMADVAEGVAVKFATYYRLERYANALEVQKPHLAFVPAAIAHVLRDQRVFPATLTMTTSQGTARSTFRVDPMNDREVAMVKSVAAEFASKPTAAETQPASGRPPG